MSKQTERDAFRSRWGFILACIGSAVGVALQTSCEKISYNLQKRNGA